VITTSNSRRPARHRVLNDTRFAGSLEAGLDGGSDRGPIVLISLFSTPAGMVDEFVAGQESSIARARGAQGFRGEPSVWVVDAEVRYPVVNIAR
jgi:hypothetical protein